MARRNSPRRAAGGNPGHRPFSLGSHWRADGAPKVAYRSQRDALHMADERRREAGATLNVYQCDYCSDWHMGSSQSRDR